VIILPVIGMPGLSPTGVITPTTGITPTDTLVRLPLAYREIFCAIRHTAGDI
jgi:hypothetical protein